MNWKQFKTWLDKNIVENEGLMVKIKIEKQNDYRYLSATNLTNFCDSLEATLDNNNTYHLFPTFVDEKNFKEIFNYQNCYFGKKTSQEKINRVDYDSLEKLFDDWKLAQKNNKNMVNWKEINLNFTEELAQEWQKKGFEFEQTKKWIEMGFRPNDYELVNFVRGNLGYDTESSLDNTAIETLKSIYQNDLENQSLLLDEDLDEQEIIRRSIISQENDDLQLQEALFNSQKETKKESKQDDKDMGWLTDDNIAYILENNEVIRENNKDVQIKKDIANIYFQMEKAKRGEQIDDDFWNSLDTSKRYILLPMRVRGNHWSLSFLVNSRSTGKVLWIRYISSHPSPDEVSEEFKEIENFLKQVGKKYGNYNNINPKEILLPNVPKQRNTWDCGVYLIKFIEFLCLDEYHNLNGRSLLITDQSIKEFREKWRKEIGENKWCKWDTVNSMVISSQIVEKRQLSKEIIMKNASENIIDLSPQMEKMEREINELKKIIQDLALANTNFSKEVKENRVQNKKLEKELQVIKKEISQLKEISLTNGIQGKREELNKIIMEMKNRIEDEELLEEVLEAQKEFTESNNTFAQKQLEKNKKKLLKSGQVRKEELDMICQKKAELTKLENEIEQQLEAKIEINKN